MKINELKTLIRGALLNEQVPGVNFSETKQVVIEELMADGTLAALAEKYDLTELYNAAVNE